MPGAFFATRSIQGFPRAAADEPETTINIVRPSAAPAPIKGDPVVEQVQGILKDLDFYSGTVDGISGPNTRKAIQAYQQKVGLNASGEIDALLLDQLGATPKTAAVPKPQPRPDVRRPPFRCPCRPILGRRMPAQADAAPTRGPTPHRQDPGRAEGIRQ